MVAHGQTACIVGQKLLDKMGWKLGQTITLKGTIYPGDWPFTIRAVKGSCLSPASQDPPLRTWSITAARL